MRKDFTVELTKSKKLLEVNTCMGHTYYHLFYGRIYNKDKTRFRRFKFVTITDAEDVFEYYEKDFLTNKEIKNCIDEYAWVTCDSQAYYLIKSYDDCQEFYDWCNETINNFNKK